MLVKKWVDLRNRETWRKRHYDEEDDVLNHWLSIITHRGVNVSGTILKTKAEELASKIGS